MKVLKKSYYNSASSGFFIAKCPRAIKLKRSTLLYAPGICDFIAYKNESKQPVYLGTLTGFLISIDREVLIEAVTDLVKHGYVSKDSDDKLHVCHEYSLFKTKIWIREIEKEYSSSFQSFKEEDLKEIINCRNQTNSYGACLKLIRKKIDDEVEPFFNFFDGFYRHFIDFLIDDSIEKQVIANDLKSTIIDLYFPVITVNSKKMRDLAIKCFDKYLEVSFSERSLHA